MVKLDSALGLLLMISCLLFIISYAMLIFSGINPFIALLWNVISSFDINLDILPTAAATQPLVLAASLVDAFIFAILAVVLATMFFDLLKQINIRKRFVMSRIRRIEQHVIIVPYNSFASNMAKELAAIGQKSIIITETEAEAHQLYKRNELALVGDPKRADIFSLAEIGKAKYVIACSDNDLDNALIAITAKSANARARIIARVSNLDNISKISSAGAYRMIMPEITAGAEMGDTIVAMSFKQQVPLQHEG